MASDRFDFLGLLLEERPYSRIDLYDLIYRYYPAYTPESCDWVIGTLRERQIIAPIGKGYYVRAKKRWTPFITKKNQAILSKLKESLPNLSLSCIHTQTINELSEMAGGDDCFIIEVSKAQLFPAYLKLRELTKKNILLNPNERELMFYLKPDSIILKPLFSKSPSTLDGSFSIEKLFVDLLCDRLFQALYPGVDFSTELKKIVNEYDFNLGTALNYAARRKCKEQASGILFEALPEAYIVIEGEPHDQDW